MTNSRTDHPAPDKAHPSPANARRRVLWERANLAVQLLLSLAVAVGVLIYLIYGGKNASVEEGKRAARPEEVVQVVGPRSIRIRPGTGLDSELHVATAKAAWLTAPILPVTGAALASLRPGTEVAFDAWQFATPDLLSAFTDWQKAVTDIQYQETQLKAIRDLNESRISAQKEVVARMEKLVAAGTDTVKDLVAERTNLIQFEIQGRKDIRDQEEAVRLAHRTEAALSRQLQQAGLEPAMLRSAAAEGDIVVAEVPERLMDLVKLGMTCEVRFYALPSRVFTGKVSGISPVVSKDKRVLNVQFIVKDSENLIRPGMFAQVGLGTDKRQSLLIPADGVLHVGEKDYILVETEPQTWEITEVQIGELRGSDVEVLSGVKADDRVLGKGAILIKPVVVRCLQATDSAAKAAVVGRGTIRRMVVLDGRGQGGSDR